VLTCFGLIWNYDKFSRQNTKSRKICAHSKTHISPNLIVKKNIAYWGTYKYNIKRFEKIQLKIPLGESMFLGIKDPQKNNSLKCKINTFTYYMSFGPKCAIYIFTYVNIKKSLVDLQVWIIISCNIFFFNYVNKKTTCGPTNVSYHFL
jgi:hypothetical protein